MFDKDYRQLSVVKHVVGTTIALPATIAAFTALPHHLARPDDMTTTVGLVTIAAFTGLLLGPPLGFILWLMNRGLHVLFGLGRDAKAAYQRGQYEARLSAAQDEAADHANLQQINDALAHPEKHLSQPTREPLNPHLFPEAPVWDGPPQQEFPHQGAVPPPAPRWPDNPPPAPVYDEAHTLPLTRPMPMQGAPQEPCCQTNYGPDGRAFHGGPGCRLSLGWSDVQE